MTEEHPAAVGRRLLDVSHLPKFAFGHRDPIWWGLLSLLAIEATMFALLATSYLYLRGNFSEWPPPGVKNAPLWLSSLTVLALLASALPAYVAFKGAIELRLRPIQLGMLLCTLLSAVALALRAWELAATGHRWNGHAYGSIVWALYFMHTFHLTAGVAENVVMTTLLYKGPVEKKLMPDLRLSCIYWWFVVFSWVPLWAMIALDEVLR